MLKERFVGIPMNLLARIPQELLVGLVDRITPAAVPPTSEKVRREFKKLSSERTLGYVGVSSPWYSPLVADACASLRDILQNVPLNVLDLGCGVGDLSNVLLRNGLQVRSYTGIDLAPPKASRQVGSAIWIAEGDVTEADGGCTGEPFDLVCAINLFPYISSLEATLPLMTARKMSDKACMLIIEPTRSLFWHQNFSEFRSILRTAAEFEAALGACGWLVCIRTHLCILSTSRRGFGNLAYSLIATPNRRPSHTA